MATPNLSLPYYLNNNPVIKLSDKINDGVIVNTGNTLSGEKITFDNKYLNIQEQAKPADSFVYINASNSFGSFAFPEIQEGSQTEESFILTSTVNQEGPGYTWTNILNLPLTKYLTVDFNIDSTNTKIQINNLDSNNMPILFWDSSMYNYVGIFDLYITLDTLAVSELLKSDTGICLVLCNEGEEISQININNILDITNTVNNHFHKVKVLNNIISPNNNSNTITFNYDYYYIENYNNIEFDKNYNINIIKPKNNINLKINGTLTIFEFKK